MGEPSRWSRGFTHKRELAEFVLIERPPVDGAEVFGANILTIGMFKYHALKRNNNLLSCRRDKICGVAEWGFFRGPKYPLASTSKNFTKIIHFLSAAYFQ
jgi:hypothetical protein